MQKLTAKLNLNRFGLHAIETQHNCQNKNKNDGTDNFRVCLTSLKSTELRNKKNINAFTQTNTPKMHEKKWMLHSGVSEFEVSGFGVLLPTRVTCAKNILPQVPKMNGTALHRYVQLYLSVLLAIIHFNHGAPFIIAYYQLNILHKTVWMSQ